MLVGIRRFLGRRRRRNEPAPAPDHETKELERRVLNAKLPRFQRAFGASPLQRQAIARSNALATMRSGVRLTIHQRQKLRRIICNGRGY